ncbi:MAG: NUDIX hydrolase [Planctomycetaceae bacterium]|jgi:8-oxo-dGTP pyrophosphatase MutT (NUDIX family)|nr:NUDIX hydrolase [Planctomycetaceae bacterium]
MPDRSWTRLSSRYVAEYKVTKVRTDRYRFEPRQTEADFLVCESPDWVVILPVTDDGQVVFVRQFRHGVGQVVLEIPGGLIDGEESPEEAARRELLEETGYEAASVRKVAELLPNPALNCAHCHVVLAQGCRLVRGQALDPLEQIEVVTYPLAEVGELIRSGEFNHAQAIAAFACAAGLNLGTIAPA